MPQAEQCLLLEARVDKLMFLHSQAGRFLRSSCDYIIQKCLGIALLVCKCVLRGPRPSSVYNIVVVDRAWNDDSNGGLDVAFLFVEISEILEWI